MDRAAKLISLSSRYTELLTEAISEIRAICASSGSTVIACRDDGVVLYYDRTELSAKAGATLCYCLCYIKLIVVLGYSRVVHNMFRGGSQILSASSFMNFLRSSFVSGCSRPFTIFA